MKRYMLSLVGGRLVSCGGGGGDASATSPGTPPPHPPPADPIAAAGTRVEESDPAVTLSGTWTKSDSSWGWSAGAAMQSNAAGATASLTFNGTSVRWIGSRGRGMGIASVSVDGGPSRDVDLFAHPTDEIPTPNATITHFIPVNPT